LALVGVVLDTKHLVVVLGLAAFEGNVSLVKDWVNLLLQIGADLGGLLEGSNGGVVKLTLELSLTLVKKTPERVRVEL
jgi:hypothetical protein